jgi:hypothetical protein
MILFATTGVACGFFCVLDIAMRKNARYAVFLARVVKKKAAIFSAASPEAIPDRRRRAG